jgi:stress-induced morphogen
MLIHTQEKPYFCDICGKNFRHSSNLIMHKRLHSGDRPYECKVCSKKFAGSESLKRHSIIHTDLKPFTCEICNKSFNRKSTLLVGLFFQVLGHGVEGHSVEQELHWHTLNFPLTREVLELAPWYRSKSITNRLGILENGPMQKNASWASSPP